jgi:hypothetical protein
LEHTGPFFLFVLVLFIFVTDFGLNIKESVD